MKRTDSKAFTWFIAIAGGILVLSLLAGRTQRRVITTKTPLASPARHELAPKPETATAPTDEPTEEERALAEYEPGSGDSLRGSEIKVARAIGDMSDTFTETRQERGRILMGVRQKLEAMGKAETPTEIAEHLRASVPSDLRKTRTLSDVAAVYLVLRHHEDELRK